MYLTAISFIIISITVLNVFFQARRSYKSGLSKSLASFALLVFCSFLSAIVAVLLTGIAEDIAVPLISESGIYKSIKESYGAAVSIVFILFKMIFSFVIYLPVFLILRLICGIAVSVILKATTKKGARKITDYEKENEELYVKKNKKLAAYVGAVSGFLCTVVMLMPIVGALKTAKDVVATVDHFVPESAISESQIVNEINFYADDISVSVLYVCGGELLFDLSTITFHSGKTTNLKREIEIINSFEVSEIQEIMYSLAEMDSNGIDRVRALLDRINESLILKEVLVACVTEASEAWSKGEDYLGTQRPRFADHPSIDVFMDELFAVLATSSADTIDADIETLTNIAKIVYDYESIFSSGDYTVMMGALAGDGILSKIRTELSANSHMQSLLYAVDNITMSIIADELSNTLKYGDADTELLYEEFTDILTSSAHLSGSARTTAVSRGMKESLEDFGVKVPDALTDSIANMMIGGPGSEGGKVNLGDVQSFFGGYTEAMDKFNK